MRGLIKWKERMSNSEQWVTEVAGSGVVLVYWWNPQYSIWPGLYSNKNNLCRKQRQPWGGWPSRWSMWVSQSNSTGRQWTSGTSRRWLWRVRYQPWWLPRFDTSHTLGNWQPDRTSWGNYYIDRWEARFFMICFVLFVIFIIIFIIILVYIYFPHVLTVW